MKQTATLPSIENELQRAKIIARNSYLMRTFGEDIMDMPRLWREYTDNRAAIFDYDKRATT